MPAGTAFAPVDLKVYFLRPVSPDGRDLVALGTVIHRGRRDAIGTSQVFDADGKKVAVASGSALILPGRPATVTTELRICSMPARTRSDAMNAPQHRAPQWAS